MTVAKRIWTHAELRHQSGVTRKARPRDLTRDQMGVAFQAIVSPESGEVWAYEALMRCTVPGWELPLALIEQAHAEGSVGYVGRLAREVAFTAGSDVPLFVNVHPDELSSRWLVRPDDPLNFHDHTVYLEIGETTAFWQFDLCRNVLREVCMRSGARLVIDDFGAGHSNLCRIADLEPAVVKLDATLIRHIHGDRRRQGVVRHLVGLFAEIGALTVAEGVETLDELSCVRDLGVDHVQGYLIGRPASAPAPIAWPPRTGAVSRPSERPTERPTL